MQTGPCTSQQAFIQQVQELQKSETLPPPKEVEIFLQNNTKWLEQLRSNPAVGSSLIDVSKRIRATTTNHDEAKRVADYVQGIGETMRPGDELVAQIMSMSLGGASPVERKTVAESGSVGRDEKARKEAATINNEKRGIKLYGHGSDEQAVNFVTSLGPYIHFLDLSNIEVTSEDLKKIAEKCPEIRHLVIDSSKLSDDVAKTILLLQKLEFLDLRGSSGISIFKLEDHPSIQMCYLGKTDITKIELARLTNLTLLHFEGSNSLDSVVLQGLEKLSVVYGKTCEELKHVQFSGGIPQIKELNFPGCIELPFLDVTSLSGLQILCLYECESLTGLNVTNVHSLKELDVAKTALKNVQGLTTLKSITELNIEGLQDFDETSLAHIPPANVVR